MSSYRSIIIFVILIISSIGCANQTNLVAKPNYKEDLTMMLALDSERNQDFRAGFIYYYELYKSTAKENYLKKAIYYSFRLKDFKMAEKLTQEGMEKFDAELYTHEYILALSSQKYYEEALKIAKSLLKESATSQNYALVANIYFQQKNYKEAIKYYESAYAGDQNESTLLQLVNILYNYLDKKDEALAYLETYVQTNKCNPTICNRLMLIYQEQGNVDGMLSILTRMYNKYKDSNLQPQAMKVIENLIISLLERKDIKKAIKFLEDNRLNQDKLINLYYQDQQLEKALKLTKEIYNQTKNPELLGKIAMYRFELAKDKRKVLKHVIANFELALSSGINNAGYQNYYGYLLIDYDIDIEKGLSLVQEALKQSPNNLAYLDSLAWGYYKQKNCKKAQEIMTQVINRAGLKDPEIKLHWNIIKDCKGTQKE
jgi:predicted Zn-dependent protease